MEKHKIGYERLNIQEKKVYEMFEKAFASYADTVDAGSIDKNVDVMKVLQVALGDNPQVFYFNKTQIKLSSVMFGGKKIHFCGTYSSREIRKMKLELEKAIKDAVDSINMLNPISDYDKLMCIYEYLQDHVRYDTKELEACCQYGKCQNPAAHTAYGALIQGNAVCDGIASAFALLVRCWDYDCTVVSGTAAFMTEGFSSHAWNVIRVNDKYYHVDPTWDVNHKERFGNYSYEYFCIDDNWINTDHNWDINTTPPCGSSDLSFYVRNGCYANNLTQLDDIFRRYARSKVGVVRVRIADTIAIPEPNDTYIAQRLLNAGTAMGKCMNIEYAWDKNTRCFYAKF